jgi:hypothetical protein
MELRSNAVVSLRMVSIAELLIQRFGKFGMQVLIYLWDGFGAVLRLLLFCGVNFGFLRFTGAIVGPGGGQTMAS